MRPTSPGDARRALGRLAPLALLLVGVTAWHPAAARAEDPPAFLLKWGRPGSGPGQFDQPQDLAVSSDGFLYVADTGNQRIQKFTTDSVFVAAWATGLEPTGIAVDPGGTVYVTEGNNRVYKYDPIGTLLTSWAVPTGSANVGADPAGGVIYVTGGTHIAKYTTNGAFITSWTYDDPNLDFFWDLAVGPSGSVYATKTIYGNVVKFTSSGSFVTLWGSPGGGLNQFSSPTGIAVDASESVYVGDNDWVRKFNSVGGFLTRWGGHGSGDGQFSSAEGIGVDVDGNIYVLDAGNNRVQKFGDAITPTHPTTWGRIKALYR